MKLTEKTTRTAVSLEQIEDNIYLFTIEEMSGRQGFDNRAYTEKVTLEPVLPNTKPSFFIYKDSIPYYIKTDKINIKRLENVLFITCIRCPRTIRAFITVQDLEDMIRTINYSYDKYKNINPMTGVRK